MGFKEALIPFAFFVISIIGIASTAINVKTYLETGKEKDSNFNFSATILAVSILGLLLSGFFTYKSFTGSAVNSAGAVNTSASEAAGSNTNLGSQQLGLANQLENIAANASVRAEKAKEGAKLANALGSTLGQLKKNN
jgi:hypothetical protein